MKFNPFNNSILYSYNDYGRTSSKYLMYGYVKLGKTTNGFFCHVEENAGHKIDWESVVFVDY